MPIYPGRDSVLEFSVDGGSNYTPIPQLESFTPPEASQAVEEVHLLDSETEYSEKVLVGLTAGNITATVAYDPTNAVHQALDALAETALEPDDPLYVRYTLTSAGSPRTYRCIGISARPQEVSRRDVLKKQYEFIAVAPVASASSSS